MDDSLDVDDRLRHLVHEVNGALFVIRGHAELSHETIDDRESLQRHLELILQSCDQLALSLRAYAPDAPPGGLSSADDSAGAPPSSGTEDTRS
ncbi:MAG: hypothetical protein ACFB21_06455 [Opitutales bacterium]